MSTEFSTSCGEIPPPPVEKIPLKNLPKTEKSKPVKVRTLKDIFEL
jgi:hypothetical protein